MIVFAAIIGGWLGIVALILAFFRAGSRHDPEDWS